MKQNKILYTIATMAIALFLAVISAGIAGTVTLAGVDFPADIAIDGAGNIYVADTGNNTIQVLNPAGDLQRTVGSGLIEYPSGVAVDNAGNIYVADDSNRSLMKFSPTGDLLKTISGEFNFPTAVAVNSTGYIFVTDSNFILTDNHIVIFDPNGNLTQSVGNGVLNFPAGVAVDSDGNIYVADSGGSHNHIMVFNSSGGLLQTIEGLNFPNGVALDSAGKIYVADTGNDSIKVFNPDGSLQQVIGTFGAGEGQFNLPMGIAVDSTGNIHVADAGNDRVQVLATAGSITGTVLNALSGAPVAGATISTGIMSTTTDASGGYTMSIAPGTYTLTAGKAGFVNSTANVTVTAGAAATMNFMLQPELEDPEVKVYDEDNDGRIERPEAIKAVDDFFNSMISRTQCVKVIVKYFETG